MHFITWPPLNVTYQIHNASPELSNYSLHTSTLVDKQIRSKSRPVFSFLPKRCIDNVLIVAGHLATFFSVYSN